jgi:hypothetical protein
LVADKAGKLVCWKCGAALKDIPRPFSRWAQCSKCRAELHVCKQCVHYAPRYITQCKHEHADKVLDKEHGNHCGFFLPRNNAFEGDEVAQREDTTAQLEALFGAESPEQADQARSAELQADSARAELERLFGIDSAETSSGKKEKS